MPSLLALPSRPSAYRGPEGDGGGCVVRFDMAENVLYVCICIWVLTRAPEADTGHGDCSLNPSLIDRSLG